LLKLYDIGVINIKNWRDSGDIVVMNLSEEFNLEYCLSKICDEYDVLDQVSTIKVSKEDDKRIEFEITRKQKDNMTVIEKVEISDFTIKVEK